MLHHQNTITESIRENPTFFLSRYALLTWPFGIVLKALFQLNLDIRPAL
jgi:hypothetical protein